jgi:hypothetical protein
MSEIADFGLQIADLGFRNWDLGFTNSVTQIRCLKFKIPTADSQIDNSPFTKDFAKPALSRAQLKLSAQVSIIRRFLSRLNIFPHPGPPYNHFPQR